VLVPRRSAADALKTRESIVSRARDVASVDGLEGVTIGRLAGDLGMSKAGVIGHFGSKVELQRAALQAASDRFTHDVLGPANGMRPGLARLLTICDAWVTHLTRPAFPGGCFFTAASCEFDGRPGVVHDEVRDGIRRWRKRLAREVEAAIAGGELDAGLDPEQAAFELYAVSMALNQEVQMLGNGRAAALARRAMRRVLGVS
jgi:AcrR family transcriptional regulator